MPKHRLSEGEKQIFAISVLWGLCLSLKELTPPTPIDIPADCNVEMTWQDKRLNVEALHAGSRILSAYILPTDVKIWIITEAEDDNGERKATTVLLPEEYWRATCIRIVTAMIANSNNAINSMGRFGTHRDSTNDTLGPQGRGDRIGPRLAARIGEQGHSISTNELYFLDLELWHRGTHQLAQQAVQEIERFINASAEDGERICDRFSGQLLCLVKVAVRGHKLHQLLNLDIVAEAELPPQPVFDHRQAQRTQAKQFPTPPPSQPGGPSVCCGFRREFESSTSCE